MDTYEEIRDKQIKCLVDIYGFNEAQSEIIFNKAFEDGHAYLDDVPLLVQEYADLVADVLNAGNQKLS